jgi:hypothetical protein
MVSLLGPLLPAADREDDAIQKRIDEVRKVALNVKIDGKAADWAGIPAFSDPKGDVNDPSRDIVSAAIAPLEDALLVMVATAGKPSKDPGAFWFNIDFRGPRNHDVQIGIQGRGTSTLWVYDDPLKEGKQSELKGLEVALGDVVEVRIPYRALAAALPKTLATALTDEKARSWLRVWPFTGDPKTKKPLDHGPAVASYRLLPRPYVGGRVRIRVRGQEPLRA